MKPLTTWQATGKLIGLRPWLFLVNALAWGVIHASMLLPGLVIRQVLDRGGSEEIGAEFDLSS